MSEIIKEYCNNVSLILAEPIVKLFLNIVLNGSLFYWILRRHKRNDDFIIEKNKSLVNKYIDCESEIFMLMNTVKINNFTSDISIELSRKISTLTIINYLFISKELIVISKNFSDYLLEISVNPNLKNIKKENDFIDDFKSKFKK